jgi:hypothetical protein
VERAPARRLGDTLAQLGDTLTPPTKHPHPKMGTDHEQKQPSNTRILRYIRKSIWGHALHPVNTWDGGLGTNCMQQEQAGPSEEGYAPKTRADCSVSWRTFAELLL